MVPRLSLALDFGGTKLAAAVVDVTHGEILAIQRRATPANQGAEASLKVMVEAGQEVLRTSNGPLGEVCGIGVSFGGPISADRRSVLRSLHVSDWDGFKLPDRLAEIFGLPAYMDNDGNAAALGEWRFGAGSGCDNMLYVQVSTGVGSGIVLGGQVFRGGGLAGEFGHLTVMADGPLCACGKRGCVESLAAGWAIARDGREAYKHSEPGSPLYCIGSSNPEAIDAKSVIEACRQDDALAAEVVERSFLFLGIGVCNAVVLLDPEKVVIGGGISRAWDELYPRLQASLDKYLPPMFRDRLMVSQARLHGTETLLGAALLTHGY